MTTNADLERYKLRIDLGIANAEDLEIYKRLLAVHGGNITGATSPASPTPTTPVQHPAGPSGELIRLNTESFEQGGISFTPPPKEGVYDAVSAGHMNPSNDADQTWWIFESRPGATPFFNGVLVTTKLTQMKDSGAWKVKQVLDVLDIKYEVVPNVGVYIADDKGKLCQVSWQFVEIKGVQQLRIQNVHRPGSATPSPV